MFYYKEKQTFSEQIKAGLFNALKVFALYSIKVAMGCAVFIYIMVQCTKANIQANYLTAQTFTLKESKKKIKNASLNLDDWLKKYPNVESQNQPTFDYSTLTWNDKYVAIGNHESQNKELLDKNEHCEHVFIGDSISYYWLYHQDVFKSEFKTNDNAMIYAHSGDVVHDIGWRLNNGNGFENLKHCLLNGKAEQKNLVLLIGTNDIGHIHSSFDVVLRDYNALLQQLVEFIDDVNKKQKVVLHIMAIFPRDHSYKKWEKGNGYFESISYVNEYLGAYVEHEQNESIKFVDCNEMMLDNDEVSKEIFDDGLHLSKKGFHKWSQCLLKYMN